MGTFGFGIEPAARRVAAGGTASRGGRPTRIVALLLAAALVAGLVACAPAPRAERAAPAAPAAEPDRPAPEPVDPASLPDPEPGAAAAASFSLDLLRAVAEPGRDAVVSPASALWALGLASQGAAGDTLAQMEAAVGMTVDDLAALMGRVEGPARLCGYPLAPDADAPDDDPAVAPAEPPAEPALSVGNSLWLREGGGLQVDDGFLARIAASYGAEVRAIPFDASGCQAVNDWVARQTRGRIPRLLASLPERGEMTLVNALALDAAWESPYEDAQVGRADFRNADGTASSVDLMASTEHGYLEIAGGTGFTRPYADGPYAFAALLPPEGTALADYLAALDGDALARVLASPSSREVRAWLSAFEVRTHVDLTEPLRALGIVDAFDPYDADFDSLGSSSAGPLFIGGAVQACALEADAEGTRGAAATALVLEAGAAPDPAPPTEVRLDRPFLYLVYDRAAGVPLFIGVVETLPSA